MADTQHGSQRDLDLRAIREASERYRSHDRHRLWSLDNRGFARLMHDRDVRILELLRRSTNGPARILDVGCGDGRLAGVARDAGVPLASWTGVDLDAKVLSQASAAHPWATFVQASADELPFAEHSFDAIVATTLFSSLPSRALERAVAAEVARVLDPSGWLIWYDLRYPSPRNRAVHALNEQYIRDLVPGWLVELRSVTVLPPVARRLGRLTGILYPVMEAVPALRSHLIGRLRPPAEGR